MGYDKLTRGTWTSTSLTIWLSHTQRLNGPPIISSCSHRAIVALHEQSLPAYSLIARFFYQFRLRSLREAYNHRAIGLTPSRFERTRPMGSHNRHRRRNNKPSNSVEFSPQHQRAIDEHLTITRSQPRRHYAHVPCKFFLQGACQAGDSCPFSHSLDVRTADSKPCEYFLRGHCKFGSRCANAHVLPDKDNYEQEDPTGQDVFPSEEYYIPQEVSELLTPEERRRRRSSGASSATSSLSLSSASSLSASLSLAPIRGSPWSPKTGLDPTLWSDVQSHYWYGGFPTHYE